jgi:transposase
MTGLPLTEIVHGADIQDRDGGPLVIQSLGDLHLLLAKIFADAGYQGPKFRDGVADIRKHLVVDIVKRSDHAKGFVLLPKRWVVERTFAWLGRCRRLAKDWENLTRNALAFLKLAAIRLMLRKLCNHS